MKTIKPQKLSVLHRTLDLAGRVELCVTAMLAAPFEAPESPLHEVALWKMLASELGPGVAPDLGLPKPRAEVLVFGSTLPSNREPAPRSVRLTMGTIDKTLATSPDDPSPLAGFGPLDITAPERAAKAGTYDDDWLAERAPDPPLDFDLEFHNTAPLDQRADEAFEGGQPFSLENVDPDEPALEGRLPFWRARVFVAMKDGELRDVPMRIETVQLFPGARSMLVIFRGVTPVAEDDASDVLQLVAACEEVGDPRPVEHYQAVLAERLDKKRGALAALRDGDLMPPGPGAKVSIHEIADPDLASPEEHHVRRNMRNKTERERESLRERLRAAGLDPDQHLPTANPPEPADPELDEIERVVAQAKEEEERQQADVERRRAEAEAQARAHGAKPEPGGPPKFSAAAELQKLRDQLELAQNAGSRLPAVEAQLSDPDLRRKLQATEDALVEQYRRTAHRLSPAQPAAASLTERARIELPAGAQGGVSFAGRDLTGVDLEGLDLRGVDLRGAFLEGAVLRGANLASADLEGAVLARADLSGADLTGAKLAGSNLGHASLKNAKLEGSVDLTRAVLAGADLSGASLRGARISRVDFAEATFHDTDFAAVVGSHLTFLKSDLRGLRLAGACLLKCNFIEVDLRGVDLTGADLTEATLVTADARGAVLRGARLAKLRAVSATSFEGADFTSALLDGANLRDAKLAGCDFSRAELRGADLSGSDLRGARFDRAIGHEARFIKADLSLASLVDANLMLGLLSRARLHGASLLGANLFRADLTKIEVDDATVMAEANLTHARIQKTKRPRGAS